MVELKLKKKTYH